MGEAIRKGGEGVNRERTERCNPVPRSILAPPSSNSVDEAAFISLEALSRKAANDSLGSRGGYLAEDQFDSLAVHLLAIGIRAFSRFDSSLTVSDRDGFSYAYRAMRGYRQGRFTEGPYVDWLRTHVRDSRFEPEGSVSVTEAGVLPESEALEEADLDAIAEQHAGGLSDRDAWTLRHVATAVAGGLTLAEVADGLLRDLADALQPQLPALPLAPDLSSFEALFDEWLREAA